MRTLFRKLPKKGSVRKILIIIASTTAVGVIGLSIYAYWSWSQINSDLENWRTFSGGEYVFKYPKSWKLSENGEKIVGFFGTFELLLLKNDFSYHTSQCAGCFDELEVAGNELCLQYTPLCKKEEKYLGLIECRDVQCGAVLATDLCVDAGGNRPAGGYGCADLVKLDSGYNYHKFILSCKRQPKLGFEESDCVDLFKKIVSSITFSSGETTDWILYEGEHYSFNYPPNLKLTETGNTIKLVTDDGVRYLVLRLDTTIKDLYKFVFAKGEMQKRMVSTAWMGSKEVYYLYEFIDIAGEKEKVRHDEYLLDLSDSAGGVLWVDLYVYEPELNENVLQVDELLKSFEFK